MKINQLFTRVVDESAILVILSAFGINGLDDKHFFSKYDLVKIGAVKKIHEMRLIFKSYYLPCKYKIYFENLNENRIITILKQVLRTNGYILNSKESNLNSKKHIYYQVMNENDMAKSHLMVKTISDQVIRFDG
jgi:hypothetical protein